MEVIIYGDIHGSEERAKKIQKGILKQEPEAVFLEVEGKEQKSYLFSSISKFYTLGHIFGVFDIESENIPINEEKISQPIYKISYNCIKTSIEFIFQYMGEKPSPQNMAKIKSPRKNFSNDNENVDKALNSLLYQMKIRETEAESTLWSRLAFLARKRGFEVHLIDLDRSILWEYGAENISNLPDKPEEVKDAYKLTIEEKKNDYISGIKRLLDITMNPRDKVMALQVRNTMEDKPINNSAVVVGREHIEGVGKILSGHFEVSFVD